MARVVDLDCSDSAAQCFVSFLESGPETRVAGACLATFEIRATDMRLKDGTVIVEEVSPSTGVPIAENHRPSYLALVSRTILLAAFREDRLRKYLSWLTDSLLSQCGADDLVRASRACISRFGIRTSPVRSPYAFVEYLLGCTRLPQHDVDGGLFSADYSKMDGINKARLTQLMPRLPVAVTCTSIVHLAVMLSSLQFGGVHCIASAGDGASTAETLSTKYWSRDRSIRGTKQPPSFVGAYLFCQMRNFVQCFTNNETLGPDGSLLPTLSEAEIHEAASSVPCLSALMSKISTGLSGDGHVDYERVRLMGLIRPVSSESVRRAILRKMVRRQKESEITAKARGTASSSTSCVSCNVCAFKDQAVPSRRRSQCAKVMGVPEDAFATPAHALVAIHSKIRKDKEERQDGIASSSISAAESEDSMCTNFELF